MYREEEKEEKQRNREKNRTNHFVASATVANSAVAPPLQGCKCNGADVEEEVELFRILNTKLRVE